MIEQAVRWCQELERISQVPRRTLDLSVDLTLEFRRPGSSARLRPIQSAALFELRRTGALFAPIGVGFGKTLVGLLAHRAIGGCRKTVYLVPAQAKSQLLRDHARWSREFVLPTLNEDLFIISHEELSGTVKAESLAKLRPDLVVLDECHKFKRSEAARTKRLLRYFRDENPGAALAALSGTMTDKSIMDYAHVIEIALRKWSALPNRWGSWPSLEEWSEALDVPRKGDVCRRPGALAMLFSDQELSEMAKNPEQSANITRRAYRRRLVETPGVVATSQEDLGCSLFLVARRPEIPPEVTAALKILRSTWKIGDEEISEATRLWDVARQIALGFYYIWDWPNGIVDKEWLEARSAWHREVREFLKTRSKVGLDSQLLYERAVRSGKITSESYAAWRLVKDRPQPPVKAIWISDFAAQDAARFIKEAPTGRLVWFDRRAFGEKVAELSGAPLCGAGDNDKLAALEGKSAVVSLRAHGTGKNLQAWHTSLVAGVPSSGLTWEQLLGRTHRTGQEADEVTYEVYLHTDEFCSALMTAVSRAQYQRGTLGQDQRLLYAIREGMGSLLESCFEEV